MVDLHWLGELMRTVGTAGRHALVVVGCGEVDAIRWAWHAIQCACDGG